MKKKKKIVELVYLKIILKRGERERVELHLRIGIMSEVSLPKTRTPETEAILSAPTVCDSPGSFSTSLVVGTKYYFSSVKFFLENDLKNQ